MHGGYNMNIRCDQKFIFCNDRGIDFGINNNYYTKIKIRIKKCNHDKGNALCRDLCNNQIIMRKQ